MARTLGKNSVDATGSSARQAFERFGPYVTISLLLIAWELASRLGLVIPFLLPPLSVVITRIATDFMSGQLPLDIAITLYRTLTAFALSAIVGVTIGIVISRNATMRWFFDPLISIGLPMPKIALLPVFMLWFGLFDLSKILMVAFSASFQIIIATWSATQSIEKELIWSAQSLGASRRDILREVILPAAMPQILTGLQIAMPICLIVVLITEMIMGGQGLGDSMLRSARYVDSPGVFAGIVEIGIVGFCVIKVMEYIRRRLLVWHQETREETTV
ncbi:MAG: ABC transporter permease [Rhodospirillaceae bacterium]|jgi:ABC-type nitrate/sulfonate/bicarbonate transport system permease component|nr:ABC transporter permease [Rhodospirillaceae bacterium]MBT6285935.1 ABC transporter permease [Rhodospirillaceae bacterium]